MKRVTNRIYERGNFVGILIKLGGFSDTPLDDHKIGNTDDDRRNCTIENEFTMGSGEVSLVSKIDNYERGHNKANSNSNNRKNNPNLTHFTPFFNRYVVVSTF